MDSPTYFLNLSLAEFPSILAIGIKVYMHMAYSPDKLICFYNSYTFFNIGKIHIPRISKPLFNHLNITTFTAIYRSLHTLISNLFTSHLTVVHLPCFDLMLAALLIFGLDPQIGHEFYQPPYVLISDRRLDH